MREHTQEGTCYYCRGHHLEHELVSMVHDYQGKYFLFTNVPARVCQQCGEQYFSPETHDRMLQALRDNTPTRFEPIAVFDLKVEAT